MLKRGYIIPGFIDLHTHGVGRYDTRTASPDVILRIAELHYKKGIAAIVPTVYAAPIADMRKNMEAIRMAMEIQSKNRDLMRQQSRIMGVHLEGPFLNPLRSGVLDKDSFLKPNITSLKRLIDGYEDIIKIITISPELKGALRVIERCREIGMKVNMGHSNATYKEALEGKRAGATGITHIFNAMRPFHHRDPGIAGFALVDEDLYVEVIADGVHLSKEVLRLIFNAKGLERIIVVSDSVRGAGHGGSPLYKRYVLRGSRMVLSEACNVLREIGLTRQMIQKVMVKNPSRYLNMD